MQFPMPHYNAFTARAPTVLSCQTCPHLAAPKTHQPQPHLSPDSPEHDRKDRPVILSAAKDLAAPQLHMSPDSPQRGRKDRPVILSAAKDLVAHLARPFTAPRVAIGGSRQTLRDAQGDTVRSLSLMRIGPHLAGPRSNSKLISSTFIAYHFDKDLIRIYILIPLQCRAQEQQSVFHELKQWPETHIRANYTRLPQKMERKTEVCLALQ